MSHSGALDSATVAAGAEPPGAAESAGAASGLADAGEADAAALSGAALALALADADAAPFAPPFGFFFCASASGASSATASRTGKANRRGLIWLRLPHPRRGAVPGGIRVSGTPTTTTAVGMVHYS